MYNPDKPFVVAEQVTGATVAADIEHKMWRSPTDLSHLRPELERYRQMGIQERPISRHATRDEAKAEAERRNATAQRGFVYWVSTEEW